MTWIGKSSIRRESDEEIVVSENESDIKQELVDVKQWILITTTIVLLTAIFVGYRIISERGSSQETLIDRSYDTVESGAQDSQKTPGASGVDFDSTVSSNGGSQSGRTNNDAPAERPATYQLPPVDSLREARSPQSQDQNRTIADRQSPSRPESRSQTQGPVGSPMIGLAPETGMTGNIGLAPEAAVRPGSSLAPEAGTPVVPALDSAYTIGDVAEPDAGIIGRSGSSPESAAGIINEVGAAPESSGSNEVGLAPETSGAGETGPGPE